jgi:hypothetical protein
MSPHTFIARLASLVPRPRTNTTIYTGVLAANSKLRPHVVPKRDDTQPRHHDEPWAALMKHSFGLPVPSCARCKGRLRFVAVLFDRAEIKRQLSHLRFFCEPLPIHPVRQGVSSFERILPALQGQAFLSDGRAQQVVAEALEACALVLADGGAGVQVEAVEVGVASAATRPLRDGSRVAQAHELVAGAWSGRDSPVAATWATDAA